jgi:hypothetical protein
MSDKVTGHMMKRQMPKIERWQVTDTISFAEGGVAVDVICWPKESPVHQYHQRLMTAITKFSQKDQDLQNST